MQILTASRELQHIEHLSEKDLKTFYFVSVSNSSGSSFWVPKCDAPNWLDGSRKTTDGKTLDEI